MILVGDYIDSTFARAFKIKKIFRNNLLYDEWLTRNKGFYFHISVLAAAGLGNTLSDVVGVFFGGYVELMADRFNLINFDVRNI